MPIFIKLSLPIEGNQTRTFYMEQIGTKRHIVQKRVVKG